MVRVEESMTRGRPTKSKVRQNLVNMLHILKEGYGYDLFRHYRELFSPVTMRVVYYHLKKGAELGEFQLHKTAKEHGKFSWGEETLKNYYRLGPEAKPEAVASLKDHFDEYFKSHPPGASSPGIGEAKEGSGDNPGNNAGDGI